MVKTIPLSRGLHTIVDDEDYDFLNQWKWCVNNGYAVRTATVLGKRVRYYMHRELLELESGQVGDHINGKKLDNRRQNLRACTYSQNAQNRRKRTINASGVKGVTWNTTNKAWHARIRVSGRLIHLGIFNTIEAAAEKYNQAAIRYFGEYAWLNAI